MRTTPTAHRRATGSPPPHQGAVVSRARARPHFLRRAHQRHGRAARRQAPRKGGTWRPCQSGRVPATPRPSGPQPPLTNYAGPECFRTPTQTPLLPNTETSWLITPTFISEITSSVAPAGHPPDRTRRPALSGPGVHNLLNHRPLPP